MSGMAGLKSWDASLSYHKEEVGLPCGRLYQSGALRAID